MASRYGLLPSEVLTRADTLDVYILNTVVTYQHQQAEANGEKPVPKLTQKEMQAMIDRVRSKK